MRPTLRIIRDEHAILAAILRSMDLLLAQCRRQGRGPDFASLRAMLFYIDEFPERVHHVKESELLFPKVRLRSEEAREVLERLDQDHARSHTAVRDLEHDLLGLEMMSESEGSPDRLRRFEAAVRDYVAAYLAHITLEERAVLPLAERVLSEADWLELDAAFMKDRDPLTCRDPRDPFQPLYRRILHTLPAPLGLGSAVEALSGSYSRQSHDQTGA